MVLLNEKDILRNTMEFKEKTLDSQMMYDGRIIKVYKDNVELADGKKSFREVVRHSGGVVILAIKDYDKILLVKQYRYPIGEIVLELPAGKLEKGEDPFEAAKRELEEETGYCANKWTDLGYINTSPGFSDEKLYLYLAQDLEYTHCHPDEGEIIQAFEYKYDDVLKMIDNGEINDAKTICGLMRANMKRII